jgi:hypothetical protein
MNATMNMNSGLTASLNAGLKAVACGVGALAITAVMSWSLVTSTAQVAGPAGANPALASNEVTQMAKITIQPRHVWFGQAQPAVLVD